MELSLGDKYYRFDTRTVEVRYGYPRTSTTSFLQCEAPKALESLGVEEASSNTSKNIPSTMLKILTLFFIVISTY